DGIRDKLVTGVQTCALPIYTIKDNVVKRIKVSNPPPLLLREDEGELAPDYVSMRSVQFKDAEPYSIVNLHLAADIFKRAPEKFRSEERRVGEECRTMVVMDQ